MFNVLKSNLQCLPIARNIQFLMRTLLALCLILVASAVIPQPRSVSVSQESISLHLYRIRMAPHNLPFDTSYYFGKMMSLGLGLQADPSLPTLEIQVKLGNLGEQEYLISIRPQEISIEVGSYKGYVYSMETLFQMIDTAGRLRLGNVHDSPAFEHRGIMIDTARHFISVQAIKKLIKTMPMAKLNILHWHMFDDESLSFQSFSNPQLNQAAFAKNRIYTRESISEIIDFAQLNAVSIIPEVESPAHVRAWSQNSIWKPKNITITCPDNYASQIDVSKEDAYKLFVNVTKQLDIVFLKSKYIHLGGNGVQDSCWLNNSHIKTFMTLHNIKTAQQLQLYWQKQIRKSLPTERKVIYWRSEVPSLTLEDEVILQYNGPSDTFKAFAAKTKNKIIVSFSDQMDLSSGLGQIRGDPSKFSYVTALQLYTKIQLQPQGIDQTRILGGEGTLSGEFSNEYNLQNNLWMRAAALGQRLWVSQKASDTDFVRRMILLQQVFQKEGVEYSPMVSQYCETYIEECFPQEGRTSRQNAVQLQLTK